MLLKPEIKATLKEAGYNQRMVSVKERSCGYSQAYIITVRSKDINIKDIKALLSKYELQRRCEASGDFLQGANVYIDYYYSDAIEEEVKADPKLIEEAKKIYDFYNNEVKGIKGGLDYKELNNKNELIRVCSYSNVYYDNLIKYEVCYSTDEDNYKYYNTELKQQLTNIDSVKDFLFKLITQYNYSI